MRSAEHALPAPARSEFSRLAPGGSPIPLGSLRRALEGGDAGRELCAGLAGLLEVRGITLHASGREAMRVVLSHLASSTGRHEVVVPAYVCFSVPAAAVAAGLRVRLVDVDGAGRLDPEALRRIPLERVAAVVVGNLFGVPEPLEEILSIVRPAAVAVIDDAAQALGARCREGWVGARSEVGVLSFGRGKPLSALGGGALAWSSDPPIEGDPVAPRPLAGALRALGYDLARWPPLLGVLSRIPALGIGETIYDPDFTRGPMPGAALSLARALLPELAASGRARAAVAAQLADALAGTPFRPLLAAPGDIAVHPRLGVVAADADAREAALSALRPLGASAMYPSSLTRLAALQPHRVGETRCPGAEAFASRLLTLPTHRAMEAQVGAVARLLRA